MTLCYADVRRNDKGSITRLAGFLESRMAALLQSASNALQARLDLEILLEVRPTVFHVPGVRGWSLTLLAVAHGHDEADARRTWGIAMQAAREALMDRDAGER